MVLLDTGTPSTSIEIYSEDADHRDTNSQPLGYKPSALAIELNNSELLLGRSRVYPVGVLHHYVYHFSTAVDFSSEKYSGSTREVYSEDADDGTQTRNPSVIN